MSHTLIPEARTYAIAAVLLGATSTQTIAAHLHVRWLGPRGAPYVRIHVAALTTVLLAGGVVMGPRTFGASAVGAALGVPLGIAGGALVIVADRAVVARLRPPRSAVPVRVPRAGAPVVRPAGLALRADATQHRALGAGAANRNLRLSPEDLKASLVWLVVVAVAEEAVFRGVLVGAGLSLPALWLRIVALAAVTGGFALAHVFYGWTQVVAKLPLALVTLAATLATRSLVAAVVTHALFNAYAWRYRAAVPTMRAEGSR